LQVCNHWGSPGSAEDLIAIADRNGTLVRHVRFLVEPDMDRLQRENETVAPGVWHFGHIDFGPTETDWGPTHVSALYATLKALNEWGASRGRGDEFVVTHAGVGWIDERGAVRPMATEAASEPTAAEPARTAAAHKSSTEPETEETPENRDNRRHRELRTAGGDYVYAEGRWRATGSRGLVAELWKREKAAGRPMSDERDVRESLKMASERARNVRAKGNSAFNQ